MVVRMVPLSRLLGCICVLALFAPQVFAASGQSPAQRGDSSTRSNGPTPSHIEALHDRAAAALAAGKLDKALIGFSEVLRLNPRSSFAYYNRGIVHFRKHQLPAAIADFTSALEIDPSFVLALMNRGVAHSEFGELDEALVDLGQAIRLEPENGESFFNRSIVHARKRDAAAAILDYEAAIARSMGEAQAAPAGARLRMLLMRDAGSDPSRLSAEVAHARSMENLLQVIQATCVSSGHDRQRLYELARSRKWKSIPEAALAAGGNNSAKVVAAWNFSDSFGSYIVAQSELASDPQSTICSITTHVGSRHLLEDLRSGFASKFDAIPKGLVEAPDRSAARYWINVDSAVRIEAAIIFNKAAELMSVRLVHEN